MKITQVSPPREDHAYIFVDLLPLSPVHVSPYKGTGKLMEHGIKGKVYFVANFFLKIHAYEGIFKMSMENVNNAKMAWI